MTKLSKLASVLLIVMVVTALFAGCSPTEEESGFFNPGKYTGEGDGHEGTVVVEVEVDSDNILSVEIVDHQETDGIGDAAINIIPQSIVEGQSLKIDTVAGATVSSQAILQAVEDALAKAGADIEALKAREPIKGEAETVSRETEIVVVGGGIAGLAAAIEARENGAEVILVEKLPFVGGSTIRSGGKILAAESSIQAALGVEDNAADFAEFLMEIGEHQVDEEFINLIAHNSGSNIEWLIDRGVEFAQELEPLHSYRSPDRGHFAANDSGSGFITPLEQKALELGVEILYSTPAIDLIQENGRITGIKATNDNGDDITITGKAVILATGGFSRNPDLIDEYFPVAGSFNTNVGEGNTGDGIIMGLNVGADVVMPNAGIDLMMNFITGHGYGEEATELFITPSGERFMDERDFHFTRTRILYDYEVDNFWYIIDEKNYDNRVAAAIEAGMAYEAETVEELASLINIDTETLKATLERYNELCELGEDLDFNKPAEYMVPINEGNYYALAMMKSNSGTHGGLKINIDSQVIDTQGNVIPGLYAAGEVACGQILHREYPGSGTAIIAFLTFGRQAGAAAAAE